MADQFGDLQDWGHVAQVIEELASAKALDDHQPGLARILRHDNGTLTRLVLTRVAEIRQAHEQLIAEVLVLLVRPELALDIRCQAATALGHLIPRHHAEASPFDAARVTRTMEELLQQPAAPVLHAALRHAVAVARDSASASR